MTDRPDEEHAPLAGRRVAAVGGGHGLARGLRALRQLGARPTAVVTAADDGGSSGRLRRDLDIIALGDLRMALCALAGPSELAALLNHRFARGELTGHALGNLAMVAAIERAGDVVTGLDSLAEVLGCQGRVLPATDEPVQLEARIAGQQVEGQVRVARADGPVERVWLGPPDPHPIPAAVEAMREADVIVLGPGSLFTSVIATLLVPELARAVTTAPGAVVHVLNVSTQPGETSGLDAAAHLGALFAHVPGLRLDGLVVHDGPVPSGAEPLGGELGPHAPPAVVTADVLARDAAGAPAHGHDVARLAGALAELLEKLPART